MSAHDEHLRRPGHAELAPEHKHPTWGTCLCGHDGVEHLWTSGMRVDYQGECMHRPCECQTFHADPRPKDLGHSAYGKLGS